MKHTKSNKISVGIPTYNSSEYLVDCLTSIVNLNLIDEIIISDDSSEKTELEKIKNIVKQFQNDYDMEILFIQNKENKGAFINKYNLINYSKNDFVYILDSDNIASKNLDKIINKVLKIESPENYLIQPNIMYQFWKYPKLSKFLSVFDKKYKVKFSNEDLLINSTMAKESLILNPGSYKLKDFVDDTYEFDTALKEDFLIDKWIMWVLNCGNFIVHKDTMLQIAQEGLSLERPLRSMDAIVFTYLWLNSRRSIKIYYDFFHHHRKRNNSVSFIEKEDAKKSITYFISQILSLM